MLRANFSTRPFYNERVVNLLLLLAALLVFGLTVFNVGRIVFFSNQNTELLARAGEAELRARQLRSAAQQVRRTLDIKQIQTVSASAREANTIIDRRLFSWTELFNHLETTLPAEVRISALRPNVDESGRVVLAVTVVGRRVEDVDRFMGALEATRAFTRVLSREERTTESGELLAVLDVQYVPDQTTGTAAQVETVQEKQP
jgi:Tfp pilus assembly protein PilN